jgi:CO/xanthine dehydrogenase FAD-binding subunit
LKLGALARIRDIERSALVRNDYPAIWEAARVLRSPQVRSKATIAGNICRASPSADMVPPLIALAATVRITGPSAERSLPVEELFLGPARTVLAPDEIVLEVLVPPPAKHSACVYLKLSPRHSMDLAIVGVAVMLARDSARQNCSVARIALGAVGPTPMRARKAEGTIVGGRLDEASMAEAARQASLECSPMSDVRASESYRRQMVEVMVRRALTSARHQLDGHRR